MEYIRPRIRLTNYCNRKCPYCFADDFLLGKKKSSHLNLDEIKKILDMCVENNITSVAWQGGEPMIHPQMLEIIKIHKNYNMSVDIFTNGLFNQDIIESLKNLDFQMLINLNHPSTYKSINEYNQVIKNISIMIENGLQNKISLGYNFYEDNPDYKFFLNTIRKYKIRSVRIDMVRPSISENNIHYDYKNIKNIFPKLKKMMLNCIDAGAYLTHFDCPFPICELSESDILFAWRHFPDIRRLGRCYTHVDIQEKLRISSCFCSYKFEDITLNDFENFLECRNFVKYFEDKLRWKVNLKDECENCKLKKLKICQGGCIGYSRKQKKIIITQKDLIEYKKEKINLKSLDNSDELTNISSQLLFKKNSLIKLLNNTIFPTYSLYINLNNILSKKIYTKEDLFQILDNLDKIEHPLKQINEYYEKLCKAEILYNFSKFNESETYFKSAYKISNYLDVRNILEKLINIYSYKTKISDNVIKKYLL